MIPGQLTIWEQSEPITPAKVKALLELITWLRDLPDDVGFVTRRRRLTLATDLEALLRPNPAHPS